LFSADFVNSVLSPLCAGDLSSELLSGSFEIVLGRGVWAEIWEWGLSCLWLSWLNTRVSEENLASNNVIAVVLNGLTFSGTVKDEKELFDKWCVTSTSESIIISSPDVWKPRSLEAAAQSLA
jgi:hypothetical protein